MRRKECRSAVRRLRSPRYSYTFYTINFVGAWLSGNSLFVRSDTVPAGGVSGGYGVLVNASGPCFGVDFQ